MSKRLWLVRPKSGLPRESDAYMHLAHRETRRLMVEIRKSKSGSFVLATRLDSVLCVSVFSALLSTRMTDSSGFVTLVPNPIFRLQRCQE